MVQVVQIISKYNKEPVVENAWWRHQIFDVTGHLGVESTGHRWVPLTKGSDAELWCFLCSAPEQTV